MTAAIRIMNLTRDFGAVRAVDGLSLEVPAGIIFGFLGPNGSGKTTTIRLLLGLLEPTAGRAEVLGFDTRTQADQVRERCGALLERDGLYERLSAYDNLDFYGRINRMSRAARAARIEELLTRLGLWERRHERVSGWSRGMRQKLAIARALLHRPSLVFMDEPTAGLDAPSAVALRDDLATLAAQHEVTIFLTTHNLAEAEKLCAQVAVIHQGRLLAAGRPDDLRAGQGGVRVEIVGHGFSDDLCERLRAQPQVCAVEPGPGHLTLTLTDGAQTAPLVNLLVQGGAQIEEVRRLQSSLEEVFLNLLGAEK